MKCPINIREMDLTSPTVKDSLQKALDEIYNQLEYLTVNAVQNGQKSGVRFQDFRIKGTNSTREYRLEAYDETPDAVTIRLTDMGTR